MVVDHAGRLHVCVEDRAADELEAALLQVFDEIVECHCLPVLFS